VDGVPADRELFWRLVREYESSVEHRPPILRQIETRFRRHAALLMLDTCGFTRALGRPQSEVAFLGVLLRLEATFDRCVVASGGAVLVREGDNYFAVFDMPNTAVRCAEDIIDAVGLDNRSHPHDPDLDVSMGIGYGPLLIVQGQPPVGHEMNVACKLGEDVAGPGEVLVTTAARGGIHEPRSFTERTVVIGDVPVTCFQLVRGAGAPPPGRVQTEAGSTIRA
jgi:class 3 adenylate cyclase